MSFMQAFLLGIMQAVTEFLPVSSSAHLKILKHFFGLDSWENLVLFDLSCHLGTLVVLVYFLRKDILDVLHSRQKQVLFFTALLPLIPFYFFLKPLREWMSQLECLGFCLFATGLILAIGQKMRLSSLVSRPIRDALFIGTLQSAALIPGISRSASTISCARVLGWDCKEAVRFSFLLSIPTVLGGNALEFLKSFSSPQPTPWMSCFIAFISSLTVGFFVIRFAIRWLEKGKFTPLAWYCMSLGIAAILYFNL